MPSLVKAISKIFGGGNKKSRGASDTPSSLPIDAKKIEKEKKKAQKNAAKNRGKDTVGTSFSSGPHSAEIRIPGKLYLPAPGNNGVVQTPTGNSNYKGQNTHLGQVVTIPLSENYLKLNSPMNNNNARTSTSKNSLHPHSTSTTTATLHSKHTLPSGSNLRSQRYFSDEDDDSENQGLGPSNKHQTHPYSSTFDYKFQNNNDFPSLSPSPNLAYLGTPTSSSDFCLSSDVEDEEYNRIKYQSNAGLLRPIAYSTSTEDESALFPALEGKGTGSVTSPAGSEGTSEPMKSLHAAAETHMQRPSALGQAIVSGPIHKQQHQHHANAVNAQQERRGGPLYREPETTDGEDLFSPSSRKSPLQPSRNANPTSAPTNSRFFPSQLQSPVPRSSKSNSHSDAFGFEEFVVNDWPPSISAEHVVTAANTKTQHRNSSKNIISFEAGETGDNSFLPVTSPFASDATKDFKNRSGDSVASAPLDQFMSTGRPSSNRAIASPPGRGSRSIAVPSRPSPSSYRSQVGSTRTGNSQLLDKLERELRDRSSGNNSSNFRNSSTTPSNKSSTSNSIRGAQRSNGQMISSDFDLVRRGDSSQNPDQWLMEEVSETLGPRGIAADLESLSGRSARSKTDRSIGGKSHRSHKSRSNRKTIQSSGNSVTSRTSNFSSHSYMSEASRSVANDLLRLEMQLAMVGSDRNISGGSGSVAEPAPIATSTISIGGTGSLRSKRGVSGRQSRSSPSSSSRKTVIAPPGKLGLILANKSDGRGTVVSGVRSGSALAESINIGDRIIAVDGEDVSCMNVAELTTIMTRKSDFQRKLSVISFSRSSAPSPVSRTRELGGLS